MDVKSALVHDWLTTDGGSEKVLSSISKIFPSPIYTLVHNKNFDTRKYFNNCKIHTSFIQNLPFAQKQYRNYLPLFPLAVEQFDLREYDLILSSSHSVAKGVLTNANQLHICYCHSPVRYAWDLYHQYLEESNLNKGLKSLLVKTILHYLRNWDITSLPRVDYFIANSSYIAKRLNKLYNREAKVIYPPVNVDEFNIKTTKEDYFVTISRMVPYKKIDLIVEAFNEMPEKKLIVIGDGPDFYKIKKKAKRNIELMGYLSFDRVKILLEGARAFMFAAEEDFGIVIVEAQACGTPVITFGKGGALETVESGKTGLFYKSQTKISIINAVKEFEKSKHNYDPEYIGAHAQKYSTKRFINEYRDFVSQKVSLFYK